MRLGIDASNLQGGGGLTHLREFLRHIDQKQHCIERVTVWSGKQTLKYIEPRPSLYLEYQPSLDGGLAQRLCWQQTKLAALAADACDLLFVPGNNYTGTFRPYVTMSRNMLPFELCERLRYGCASRMFLKMTLLHHSQRYTFKHADAIIFLTEFARKTILKQLNGWHGKDAIIPHGIGDQFRLAPRPQRLVSSYSAENPFKLLYVSIVAVYKHQWHVARAVKQLRDEGLCVALDFAGPCDRPAYERLRQTLEDVDPKSEFIHYRDEVDYIDLPAWYHSADAFVFASTCENMPNILVEAMASGLPIACSQKQPMPEVLGHGGLYFDAESPTDIARAIRRLMLDETLRTTLAANAYSRSQAWSWERCARETLSFLVEVAKS